MTGGLVELLNPVREFDFGGGKKIGYRVLTIAEVQDVLRKAIKKEHNRLSGKKLDEAVDRVLTTGEGFPQCTIPAMIHAGVVDDDLTAEEVEGLFTAEWSAKLLTLCYTIMGVQQDSESSGPGKKAPARKRKAGTATKT